MKVSVEPVIGNSLAHLISMSSGTDLGARYAEMMDMCQKLSGQVWSGYIDEKLVCCWGLIPPSIFSNVAYLWMYNTEALAEHQFIFIRRSQLEIARMLEYYPLIVGHCVVGNDKASKWLEWLGAKFDPPADGVRKFSIRKHTDG